MPRSNTKKKSKTAMATPTINGKKVTIVVKTIAVLAQLRKLKIDTPTRDYVMKMCGFTKPASFNVTIGKEAKKNNALLELPNGKTISLTKAGIMSAPKNMGEDTITCNTDLQRNLKKVFKIGGNPEKMFDLMCDGQIHTNSELAIACGRDTPNASHNVQRSTLVGKGFVEKSSCGGFRLTSMCFLKL